MKRSKIVFLTVLSLVAVAVAWVGVAQAAPELLGTVPNTFSGTGGAGDLNTTGGNNVECKSNEVAGEVTSSKEGKVSVRFKECSKGCKTTGAAAKEIDVQPTQLHIGLATVNGEDTYISMILNLSESITCTGLTVAVKGNLILTTTLKNKTKAKKTTLAATQSANGVQSIIKCEEPTELCGTTEYLLKAKFGEGVEETASEVQSDEVTFASEVEAVG
jgi:hypothetical protein